MYRLFCLEVIHILLLSYSAKGVANNTLLAGFTIDQIDNVFNTELRTDFGFPLSQDESDDLWVVAKEWQNKLYGGRSSVLWPYLICVEKAGSSARDRLVMLQDLLLSATQDSTGEVIHYYYRYDDKLEEAEEADKSIPIEVAKNEQDSTCFFTTIYTAAVLAASTYEDSEHVQFQVITPSMAMRRGTIDMVETIMNGGHNTLKEVALMIHVCPIDDETDVTSGILMEELEVYLSASPDDTLDHNISNMTNVSLVTKESFFANLVSSGEETVSSRMAHWTNALARGVEATSGCPDTMERTSIVDFDDGFFVVRIEKEDDAFEAAAKDALSTVTGYTDKDCVYSILAALAEMPLVCVVELFWPIALLPVGSSDTVTSEVELSDDETNEGRIKGGSASSEARSFWIQINFLPAVAAFITMVSLFVF